MAAYGYLFGGGGVHHIYRLTTVLIEYYFSFNFVTRVVTHKYVPVAQPRTSHCSRYHGSTRCV